MRNLKYPTVIPISTMVFIVGAMFLGLYIHMPDEREIIESMVKDSMYIEAHKKVNRLSQSELEKHPVFYNYVKIQSSRILHNSFRGAKDNPYKPYSVEEIWKICEKFAVPPLLFGELMQAIQDEMGGPRKLYSLFEPHVDKLSKSQMDDLCDTIFKQAIAQGDITLAAEIYTEYLITNLANFEMVSEAVKLFRMSGDPKSGLQWLNEYIDIARFEGEERRQMTLKYARLALESGSPAGAVDVILEFSKRIEEHLYTDEELFELLVSCAIGSGQSIRIIPFLESKIGSQYETEKDLKMYIELLIADNRLSKATALLADRYEEGRLSSHFKKFYAQTLEWDSKPAQAYELYEELVREEKDKEALDRMIALHTGLFKHEDLALLLMDVYSPDTIGYYALTLARLLVQIGRYEQSVPYFEKELEKNPENTRLLNEIADAYRTSYSFELSLKYYLRVNEIDPTDYVAMVRSAEMAAYLGNFDLALALYRDAYAITPKATLIPLILNLASTTRREDIYYLFIEEKIDQSIPVEVDDYLDLAYVLSQQDRKKDQIKYLNEGLKQFPNNQKIQKELVYAYYDQKRFTEAFDAIQKLDEMKTDSNLISLYLSLCLETGRQKRALALVSELDQEIIHSNQYLMSTAAWVYELHQMYVESDSLYTRLYQQYPENPNYIASYVSMLVRQKRENEAFALLKSLNIDKDPELLRAMSYVYSQRERYSDAEDVQKKLLLKTGKNSFYDWGNLGDIRLSLGNKTEAERAYWMSLNKMLKAIKDPKVALENHSENPESSGTLKR